MSITPSNAVRDSSAYGAALRIAAYRSSTFQSSIATMATICCDEDVERIPRIPRRFDRPLMHRLSDSSAGHEIAAELREDDAARLRADLVARASDPLHARGDGWRCFDLDDEIDGAHVDPSSSEDVATSAGNRPDLRLSSISTRCARAIEP